MLSDAVTADGQDIRKDILHPGKPFNNPKGLMPYQDNPSPKAWLLWRQLLHQFTIGNTTVLQHDLGRWFQLGDSTHHKWQLYYCAQHDLVYLRKSNSFEIYHRHLQEFTYSGKDISSLPSTSVPADLTLDSAQISLLTTKVHVSQVEGLCTNVVSCLCRNSRTLGTRPSSRRHIRR